MKRRLVSFCLLLVSGSIYAQSHEGTVELQNRPQPAAVIELPYAPDRVSAALEDHLSKKGRSKGSDLKGFTTFRNTQQVQNDSVNADIYIRVERKSKKEKETSVVSLLLTMPGDSTVAANNTISHLNMEQAKTWLNELVPAIDAYNLEMRIKDQNEEVKKAESKFANLANDGADLEKKRTGIEKKILENKQDQQAQGLEVENQKQKLAVWVSQRKS